MFRAAKWLGVAPWDLARMPVWWRDRALLYERAEASAREAAAKQAEARRKRKVGGRRK